MIFVLYGVFLLPHTLCILYSYIRFALQKRAVQKIHFETREKTLLSVFTPLLPLFLLSLFSFPFLFT